MFIVLFTCFCCTDLNIFVLVNNVEQVRHVRMDMFSTTVVYASIRPSTHCVYFVPEPVGAVIARRVRATGVGISIFPEGSSLILRSHL